METKERPYEVVITQPAYDAFFEILEYFLHKYSVQKTAIIADEINVLINSLQFQPERGAIEKRLTGRYFLYRFLLYQRSTRADIKVIYFVDKLHHKVYITDLFPTEKDDRKIDR